MVKRINVLVSALAVFTFFLVSNLYSQEMMLTPRAGLGYGQVVYGSIEGTDSGEVGKGPSTGFTAGALFNYSLFAVDLDYAYATIGDTEAEINGVTTTAKGSGSIWTFDPKIGAKLLSKPGDMGYTLLFIGMRMWNSTRTIDSQELNGIEVPGFASTETIAGGSGYIIGIRDFSTYNFDSWSLVLQTGLWFDSAPAEEVEVDGVSMTLDNVSGYGIGFEIGLGVAFEDMGLSVTASYKTDVNVTIYEVAGEDWILAAGLGHTFLTVTKEIPF